MWSILWKLFFPNYTKGRITTVRYAFPIVAIAALFSGFAAVISENSSYITVRTNADTVKQNDSFTIDVQATAHIPVNAVDIVIGYPKGLMVIDSIDTGSSVISLWTEEPYAKDGNIYLRGGTFRKGFVGEHSIASIKAHAIAQGEARVMIKETQLVAGDGKGSVVPLKTSDAHNEARIMVMSTNGTIAGKASVTLITDTNGDGKVDLADISKFMAAWFTKGSTYDFNGDGRMTFIDFSILLADSFGNK